MPNKLLLAIFMGLWAVTAWADGINVSGNIDNADVGMHEGILIPGVAVSFTPAAVSHLMLEDNTSFFLLEDNTSKLCLENSC